MLQYKSKRNKTKLNELKSEIVNNALIAEIPNGRHNEKVNKRPWLTWCLNYE